MLGHSSRSELPELARSAGQAAASWGNVAGTRKAGAQGVAPSFAGFSFAALFCFVAALQLPAGRKLVGLINAFVYCRRCTGRGGAFRLPDNAELGLNRLSAFLSGELPSCLNSSWLNRDTRRKAIAGRSKPSTIGNYLQRGACVLSRSGLLSTRGMHKE